MLNVLIILVIMAFMIEKIVEVFKLMLPFLVTVDERFKQVKIFMVLSLIIALVVAWGANIDLFALMEIEFAFPYVGIIGAAIVMSAGSNFVHDFLEGIKARSNIPKGE